VRAGPALLVTVALVVGLAGCGDASSSDAARTAPGDDALSIASPADGSQLRARDTQGDALRLRTQVRGSARPGSVVLLRATCRPRRCDARATAAADGRWTVAMTLTTTRAALFVTIDATVGQGPSARRAVTTVELVGPRRSSGDGAAGTRSRGDAARRTRSDRAATPTPARRLPQHDVLVIGDSLAIGMADSLRAALPGWRVRIDARIGRPLGEGMQILAAERDPPAILALSLFTNDGPRATAQLAQAVRATATRPGGCAVWATIAAPPIDGVSYAAANELLEQLARDPDLAPGLQLVDWRSLVGRDPSFLEGDRVHGTPEGYRALGRLYADAIRACAGET